VIRSALVIVGAAVALSLTACQKPQAQPEAHVEFTPAPTLDQSERPPVQPLDAYVATPPPVYNPEPAYTPPPEPVIKPADKPVRPAHRERARTYVVKKGDTLSEISQKFYNTPNRWRQILKANPHVKSPKKLQVGTKLVIP